MEKLILIKLGGSVVTDKSKPFTAKPETIKRLVSEIKQIQKKYKGKIIIGHGGGSFPHVPASNYKTHLGNINKNSVWGFCKTAEAAIDINRIVVKEFLKQKINTITFSPLSLVDDDKIQVKQIEYALSLNILPLLYGDVVFDKKLGFKIYSTEAIFTTLIKSLGKSYIIEKIIMAGDTDGVYDQNKKTIKNINAKNIKNIKKQITGSKATDVTGGMLHKVEKSLALAKKEKIKTIIINGNRTGELTRAVFGKEIKGTVIC